MRHLRNGMPQANRRGGFTLIEMIVATILLAIGVLASVGVIDGSEHAAATAHDLEIASYLASEKMSDAAIQASEGQINTDQQQGNFSPEHPNFHWQESVQQGQFTNLYLVKIVVQWGNPASPHSTEITSDLVNQQANNGTNGSSLTGSATGGSNGL